MKDPATRRLTRAVREQAPRMRWLIWPLLAAGLFITAQAWTSAPGAAEQEGGQATAPAALSKTVDARLSPTAHPAVPATLASMWYVPDSKGPAPQSDLAGLARGVKLLDESGDAAAALPLVSAPGLAKTNVADYARYYTGVALHRLNRLAEAETAFADAAARASEGQLFEAGTFRRAELREARGDYLGAAALYDELLKGTVSSPQIALVKLASTAAAGGDRARAIDAGRRVLAEFPLSAEAAEAEQILDRVDGFALDTPEAVAAELGRAETLFKGRKWDQARRAYDRTRDRVEGADRDRVAFRTAQIQAATGQHRTAREVFRRYVADETFAAEAQYGMTLAALALGEDEEFRQLVSDFVARNPTGPLAESALNDLARHYVLEDEDGRAAEIYAKIVERFPTGAFTERATWKAGWWAYREKNFRETVRLFEQGSATFPRSDYRPSWLYWSARAYDQLGEPVAATDRYRLTATDYLNTYYGRLAWSRLQERSEATVTPGVRRQLVAPPTPPPNAARIGRLIEIGLYKPALNEVQYAQKVWGDSPPLQGTLGLIHHRMGNLRLGINAMKRAYPQYMAAGGETLPPEILRVLFPIDYWPLLKGHAQARGVDPYIVAALVAQESTFDAGIRSSANAIGLMQIIPSTGRRYARKIGIRPFSERTLTNPETNVLIGTQYFTELVNRFGGAHFALAGYNAGEHRVQRWLDEAPGLPQDEFIDNIPFPETQNYVKRILGTAEDYRRLYGEGVQPPEVTRPARPPAKKSTAAPARKSPAKKTPAKKSSSTTRRSTPPKR